MKIFSCKNCNIKFTDKPSASRSFCSRKCIWQHYKPGFKTGHKLSVESIKKMSETKKRNPTKYWLGKNRDAETNRKIRESLFGRFRAEKSSHWITDRNMLVKRQERNDMSYKYWRKKVKDRDFYKCKLQNEDCKGRLEVHHIFGWTECEELRYNENNGITLCHSHHPRKKIDEERLFPLFIKLVGQTIY